MAFICRGTSQLSQARLQRCLRIRQPRQSLAAFELLQNSPFNCFLFRLLFFHHAHDSLDFVLILDLTASHALGKGQGCGVDTCVMSIDAASLEALAVNDRWTTLIVFLLGDPHLLEGRERRQDGSTNPDGVLSLGWCDDLDLHRGWRKSSDLLLHAIGDTWVHGGSTGLDT
jgi:hypothetical protein